MTVENSKLLNYMMLTAIVGDFAVPYLLAIFYKGYNHSLMVMSSLGNPDSPVRIFYNIWLVSLGVLLTCSSAVIFSKYSSVSKSLSITTVAFIVIFAIGAGVIAGLFSVNESKQVVTTASKIHGIASAIGFMALLLVPLLLSILTFKSKDRVAGAVFLICFVLALIFFVLFIMADKPEMQNTFVKNEGLWQRLSLLFMYIPMAWISIGNLVKIYRKS